MCRGDDDGWLTLKEVEKAVGIHTSIVGGYYALLDANEKARPDTLPLTDVLELMKQGGTGPIRKRKVPPQKADAPDPIRSTKRYDAKHIGATPQFLDRHYAAIESTLGADAKLQKVYRGFTLRDYGGPELVRYLCGDWRCVIGSHTFTETLSAELAKGSELHEAVEKTADRVAAHVIRQIGDKGYTEYMQGESRATQIGVHNKKATAMASYVHSPLDSAQITPTAFGYAFSGFLGIIAKRTVPSTQPLIVLELEQRVPKGHESPEFYIPSHVAPTRVSRAFLGFSNWHDAEAYLVPPQRSEKWFELGIATRDEHGRPSEYTLAPALRKEEGAHTERWSVGEVSWLSSDADGPKAKQLLEQHPELEPTVQAIRAALKARPAH